MTHRAKPVDSLQTVTPHSRDTESTSGCRPSSEPYNCGDSAEGMSTGSGSTDVLSTGLREGHIDQDGDGASGLVLGLDPGSKYTGWALYDPSNNEIVAMGEMRQRQDVKKRMSDRRMYRNQRRQRKWYRPKRFNNRKRSDGWLPPTMQSKLSANLALVKWIDKRWEIDKIIVEKAEFDTHALKHGFQLPHGWMYQRGELYGHENVKTYVRIRDQFTCQCCLIDYERKMGKSPKGQSLENIKRRTQERGVEVGHLIASGRGGTLKPGNLVVLCSKHNDDMAQMTPDEFGYAELWDSAGQNIQSVHASHVSIYVPQLIDDLSQRGYQVETTVGSITKVDRESQGLPKTHGYDAVTIASSDLAPQLPGRVFKMRWMGRRRRQKEESNPTPGGHKNPKKKYQAMAGLTHGDYVRYEKKDKTIVHGFILSFYKNGSASIADIDGNWLATAKAEKFKLLSKSPRLRWETHSREGFYNSNRSW